MSARAVGSSLRASDSHTAACCGTVPTVEARLCVHPGYLMSGLHGSGNTGKHGSAEKVYRQTAGSGGTSPKVGPVGRKPH